MAERSGAFLALVASVAMLLAASASVSAEFASASEPETYPCVIECDEEHTPPGPPSMLVVHVGWDSGDPRTSSAVVEGGSKNMAEYISGRVNDWFSASAPGIFNPYAVIAAGDYTIAAPHFPDPSNSGICDDASWFAEVLGRAKAAVMAHGLDPDHYSIVAVTWARRFCGFAGISNGHDVGLSATGTTPMHELGHIFGLKPHAQALFCTDQGGARVPLGSKCTSIESGDTYDLMGQGNGAFNAIYANELGWLVGEEFCGLGASNQTTTVALKPLTELPHGLRAIRLQDGAATLWIEYRQKIGIDEILDPTPGLLIHREVTNSEGRRESQLLDMTPGTFGNFFDAGLPVGQTWANPFGTMKITNTAAGPSGATVTIASQLVTVPDLRGDSMPEAESALAAVGLRTGSVSYVPEPVCNYIETIASSNPAAGSHVFPGNTVSVTIGQVDPKHPCL
jgi:hypothetical protein